MVATLDACYTTIFIISMIQFFHLAKLYTAEQDFRNCTWSLYLHLSGRSTSDTSALASRMNTLFFFFFPQTHTSKGTIQDYSVMVEGLPKDPQAVKTYIEPVLPDIIGLLLTTFDLCFFKNIVYSTCSFLG